MNCLFFIGNCHIEYAINGIEADHILYDQGINGFIVKYQESMPITNKLLKIYFFDLVICTKNKIINVGGLKVLPSEIEEVINEVEGVLDCSVYSEENIITGNIVCVKIYTDLKNTINLKKHIKKKCISELDKYKRPVKFTFNELKINKRGKKDEKNK